MSVFTVVIQYNTRHYGESKERKINECQSLQQQQWPKNITIYIYSDCLNRKAQGSKIDTKKPSESQRISSKI